MSKTSSAGKPQRTWGFVVSLGLPLAIVGLTAMAISYATLIDVARVNGLPLPELFPILVDMGTVASMIAAAQFRLRGVDGRWIAYVTFIALSVVSIVANASHAGRSADLALTTPWAAALLAATPPATLLAITHLVMKLVPDEKERSKLQAARDRAEAAALAQQRAALQAPVKQAPVTVPSEAEAARQPQRVEEPVSETGNVRVLPIRSASVPDDDEIRARILEYVAAEGKRPTGLIVGEWLGGKSAKTGQRYLTKLDEQGAFDTEPRLTAVG